MSDCELKAALDRRAADELRGIIAANTDESGVYDIAEGHIAADGLLCDVLVGEGYVETVDVFKSMRKWYA